MKTNHTVVSLFEELQPATPLLLASLGFCIIVVMRLVMYDTLTRWGYTIVQAKIEVDEDLPNFFETVKLSDADWIVYENRNLRENYGFSMVAPEVEQRLDDWKLVKRPIRGVAWYNLLANPYYSRLFNYIEVNVPSRSDLIVDGDSDEENDCEQSDMVQLLLNLAFAPKEVVQDFVFGPGIAKTFKTSAAKKVSGNVKIN